MLTMVQTLESAATTFSTGVRLTAAVGEVRPWEPAKYGDAMSDRSGIEWTEATWNPVTGCTKVSPGCAHCYAETFAERFRGVPGHPFEHGFDLRIVPEKLGD